MRVSKRLAFHTSAVSDQLSCCLVNAKSPKLFLRLVHQWQFMVPSCQEISQQTTDGLCACCRNVTRYAIFCCKLSFGVGLVLVLESKHGRLTVFNASHLSLLSKCKISQCQLGQSPTRVGSASYQALLAQLPPCARPCTQRRINKTSPTL